MMTLSSSKSDENKQENLKEIYDENKQTNKLKKCLKDTEIALEKISFRIA